MAHPGVIQPMRGAGVIQLGRRKQEVEKSPGSSLVGIKKPEHKGGGRKAPPNYAHTEKRTPGVYGQATGITVGELMSTTGGGQTTYLEAKINGKFMGKFINVEHFMGGLGWDVLSANWQNYPRDKVVIAPWDDKTKEVRGECKPHAEDYLLVALNVIHKATGGDFTAKYPRAVGQTSDLLSIRISKAPCPSCAKNLISVCRDFKLDLRVKTALGHMDDNGALSTGVSELDTANVPVRFWTADQFTRSKSNAKLRKGVAATLKAETRTPYKNDRSRQATETAHKILFDAARANHSGADAGWGAANLSRKNNQIKNLSA